MPQRTHYEIPLRLGADIRDLMDVQNGDLDWRAVVYPRHISYFDLRTGKPSSLPVTKPERPRAVEAQDSAEVVLVGVASDWADARTGSV